MIILKRYDSGIGLAATLFNGKGGVNLTGAKVTFLFNGHEIKPLFRDAKTGQVDVILNKIHTSEIGTFLAEFEVTFKDGREESFPKDDYITIKIIKNLRKEGYLEL